MKKHYFKSAGLFLSLTALLVLFCSCTETITDPDFETGQIITLKPGEVNFISNAADKNFVVLKLVVEIRENHKWYYIEYKFPNRNFEEKAWWPEGFPFVFAYAYSLELVSVQGDNLTVKVKKTGD